MFIERPEALKLRLSGEIMYQITENQDEAFTIRPYEQV